MLPPPPIERIAVPAPPLAPPRAGFPWAATIAPVVVSVGLWVFTQSIFSLVFALLGPLVAVAGVVDGRLSRRRAGRAAAERQRMALERVLARIATAQQAERQRLSGLIALPSAPAWDAPRGAPLPVRVGTGRVASAVELTGDDPDDVRHDALRAAASDPEDGPVVVDAADGVGVVGPPALACAVARAVAAQLAARLSPVDVEVTAPPGEDWVRAGPHLVRAGAEGSFRWSREGGSALVAWAEARHALPAGCGVVVDLAGRGAVALPHAVSRAQARRVAEALTERADALGARPVAALLPGRVALAGLLPDAVAPGLGAPIGMGASGPVVVDLVAQGPHALIAGTTGSGKSELLVAWILAMAHGRAPAQVEFLLIDFKGGAAFAPLAGLPHVLATLSDLDPRMTRRAIESLRAEVLRRERILAGSGVRAIDELPPGSLARLVIVVDEFAALVAAGPQLHDVFADLAARGRSLGLHLVLCTQRPAGSVRDSVLANIGLRMSLRVTDRGDSVAMVGDDSAARLPLEPRGRAILALDGAATTVQVALADGDDARRIADEGEKGVGRSAAGRARPWCDPLPAHISLDALAPPSAGLAFGRLDLPAEQSQPTAAWDPGRHGHLLVVGASGAGITTALAALAESARRAGLVVRVVSPEPADAWAQLRELASGAEARGSIVIADDLDALLARFGDDHRHAVVELLTALLRDGSPSSPRIAAGVRRLTASLAGLSGLFGSRLLLRQSTRDDHLLAGGETGAHDPDLPPGGGWWRGAVVQVAHPAQSLPAPPASVVARIGIASHPVLAIAAARPAAWVDPLHAAGARVVLLARDAVPAPAELHVASAAVPTALIGDPDAWQAEWSLLTAARREWPMVLVGCTAADHRALVRDRELPPPLGTAHGECWLVADGRTTRAVLDLPASARNASSAARGSAGARTRESEEEHPSNR